MSKINLKSVNQPLSNKELKNVLGGRLMAGGSISKSGAKLASSSCPADEFLCYCNGYNYGCVCEIQECWDKC